MLAKKISCASLFVVSAMSLSSFSPFAFGAGCGQEGGMSQIREKYTPVGGGVKNVGAFEFSDEYSGRLVQSFTFDRQSCRWIVAVSVGKKPEQTEIWAFPGQPPYNNPVGPLSSDAFAHPQSLSADYLSGGGRYWLPSQDRKHAVRFALNNTPAGLAFGAMESIEVASKPITGIFTSISADGHHLIVQGAEKNRDTGEVVQLVTVYRISKAGRNSEAVKISERPEAKWPLSQEQQDKSQWRQGVASVGDSVFVLSGDHSLEGQKVLYTYSLDGEILDKKLVDAGRNQAIVSGSKTLEPEGLDVVINGTSLSLAFGIAKGSKGHRTFELWSMPLAVKGF